jgi:hypothetical protein
MDHIVSKRGPRPDPVPVLSFRKTISRHPASAPTRDPENFTVVAARERLTESDVRRLVQWVPLGLVNEKVTVVGQLPPGAAVASDTLA